MGRIIGIQHRVKKSVEGEARPTIAAIRSLDGEMKTVELESEQDELDFVLGRFPVRMRQVREGESLSDFLPHHVKATAARTLVPASYDGLSDGDTLAMSLGGSGRYLAYAASRVADEKGGRVIRVPPSVLSDEREARGFAADKSQDAQLLVALAIEKPDVFYPVMLRDRVLIHAQLRYRFRMDAMKARIGCEQRLRQRYIGNIFTSPEGKYPEGAVEDEFAALKASDRILNALEAEEHAAIRELIEAIEPLPVFQQVFKPLEGMDVKIAARLIANVPDIRQFPTVHKFVAFCGVHVLDDGRFARRRNDERANWNNDCRSALYLFADQANFREDSVWGKKLREIKARIREKHPEPVVGENGKKRYTPGHTKKMAHWRFATIFARYIYKRWLAVEQGKTLQAAA